MIETVSQQIKQIFSEATQVYINELENRVSELDPKLSTFSLQIDKLLAAHQSLREASIQVDFHSQSPSFVSIVNRFEEVIKQLGDRPSYTDRIIIDLLLEAVVMIRQIINEYCFESEPNPNWMELQNNLFAKINEHLALRKSTVASSKIAIQSIDDRANEPFNPNDTMEGLHLFDLDNFELNNLDDFPFLSPSEQSDDDSAVFLIQLDDDIDPQELNHELGKEREISLDEPFSLEIDLPNISNEQLDNQLKEQLADVPQSQVSEDIGGDFDTQLDRLIKFQSNETQLPIPEILKEIFPLTSNEQLLGSEDETVLQGVNWRHGEDDLDNHWNKFTSLQSWSQINAPNADIETSTLTNQNQSESIFDNNVVDEISSSFLEPLEFDPLEFDPLEEDESAFWSSLESMESLESIDSLEELQLPKSVVESIIEIPSSFEDLPQESTSFLLDTIDEYDFSTSDVDTAIEESPIYQNKAKDELSENEELGLISFERQVTDFADRTDIAKDVALDLDNGVNNDFEIPAPLESKHDLSLDLYSHMDLDTGMLKPLDSHLTEIDNDVNIRIPLNYLEIWEDLSEELLIRKGNLDIYLGEIRLLAGELQRNLRLEPQSVSQTPMSIAELQNTLERLTHVIERTEQQTYAMSHDVRHLRQNFRQVLKYPISSLVRKFPRILRDLSLEYGKQVELIVQGSEIGIERIISDLVAETLDLLIRNAFEYSIETASERQEQGKSSQGKIEVVATQTDDNTIIKVIDDGRGLDNLSNNISYLDNTAKLRDVRKKLWDVGGTISVQSQLGKGTQLTLTLPNTISLLRVLLIGIDKMCLAISSKVILEVVPIKNEELSDEEPETLAWGDRVIPIVRLNTLLQLNCQLNSHQNSALNNSNPAITSQIERYKPAISVPSYLIVQYEHYVFALQTDGCWHEQEATFHQIEGDIATPQLFLGAAILGNNQTVALINHLELVTQCLRSHPNIGVSNPQSAQINQRNFNNLQANIPQPENLNSLSDFFERVDSPIDTDISEFLEQPVRSLGRSSEPENLESSGVFMSDLADGQKRISNQPKVLIVESSANVRRYLAMTLTKSGFLTEQVQDGKAAIAFLKERLKDKLDIDLVITDLEMPQMDGFKLLTNIRAAADLHNLPVVVLAARSNENDRKLALELGANAYFSKPYREQELVKTLQELVSK